MISLMGVKTLERTEKKCIDVKKRARKTGGWVEKKMQRFKLNGIRPENTNEFTHGG